MSDGSVARSEVAGLLTDHRLELGTALLASASLIPRFAEKISALGLDTSAFVQDELVCIVDYVASWIGRRDDAFAALYLGERAKMAYDAGADAATRNATICRLIEKDKEIFLEFANGRTSDQAQKLLKDGFETAQSLFNTAFEKELKLLLIGDCLHLDVISFLTGHAAKHKTAVIPQFITDKNPAKILSDIKSVANEQFDAIFFSPLTYEYNNAFLTFLNWRNAAMSKTRIRAQVEDIFSTITPTIETLANIFACPIFVHNAAIIMRASESGKLALKNVVTRPMRQTARTMIDDALTGIIAKVNQDTFHHVHKFDELHYLKAQSETSLGEIFYHAANQHPARLGAEIAGDYNLICETLAHLLKKKLIVCDLDNTLWDGVIGEGAVTHFHERQTILKKLQAKGVVLAIASKNDPANVHWDGGVLNENDFVYSHINWDPKVNAFPKMESSLNLKMKDFVFIDDRADEREMVEATFPAVKAFDAMSQRTWQLFDLWASILDASGMDRTKMYLERTERNEFLGEDTSDGLDEMAMFASLDLKIDIRLAEKSDVKRATELINRTNQFNMTAARTSLSDMQHWQKSDTHQIFIADMSDRFGDMGTISILVTEETDDAITIPFFVLSCRVFGYGAETAILNEVKKIAQKRSKKITGTYVETLVNSPCKNTYEENGFTATETGWTFSDLTATPTNPEWLTVISTTS